MAHRLCVTIFLPIPRHASLTEAFRNGLLLLMMRLADFEFEPIFHMCIVTHYTASFLRPSKMQCIAGLYNEASRWDRVEIRAFAAPEMIKLAHLKLHEKFSCLLGLHMAESGQLVIPTAQQPALLSFSGATPEEQNSAGPFTHICIRAKRRPGRLRRHCKPSAMSASKHMQSCKQQLQVVSSVMLSRRS